MSQVYAFKTFIFIKLDLMALKLTKTILAKISIEININKKKRNFSMHILTILVKYMHLKRLFVLA